MLQHTHTHTTQCTYVPLLYLAKCKHHSPAVVASLLATTFLIPSSTLCGVTYFQRSGFILPNVVSVVTCTLLEGSNLKYSFDSCIIGSYVGGFIE